MITSRRSFLTGLVSLVAAPAIVRATALMPVKSLDTTELLQARIDAAYAAIKLGIDDNLYRALTDATRRAFVPRLQVQVYGASPFRFYERSVSIILERKPALTIP